MFSIHSARNRRINELTSERGWPWHLVGPMARCWPHHRWRWLLLIVTVSGGLWRLGRAQNPSATVPAPTTTTVSPEATSITRHQGSKIVVFLREQCAGESERFNDTELMDELRHHGDAGTIGMLPTAGKSSSWFTTPTPPTFSFFQSYVMWKIAGFTRFLPSQDYWVSVWRQRLRFFEQNPSNLQTFFFWFWKIIKTDWTIPSSIVVEINLYRQNKLCNEKIINEIINNIFN